MTRSTLLATLGMLAAAFLGLSRSQATVTSTQCGVPVVGDLFPWMAYLDVMFKSEVQPRHCEAMLISNEWLISAASCAQKDDEPVTMIVAHLGKTNASFTTEPGQITQFVDVVLHPSYPNFTVNSWSLFFEFDFVLLKLRRPIVFTSSISPICLPDEICNQASAVSSYSTYCEQTVAVGWDFRDHVLRKRNVSVLSAAECDAALSLFEVDGIPIDKMCTGQTLGGNCYQNSVGGPLLCKRSNTFYSIGILSGMLDDSCPDTGRPLIYGRVCHVLPWIRSIIGGNKAAYPSPSFYNLLPLIETLPKGIAEIAGVQLNQAFKYMKGCYIPTMLNSRVFIGEEEAFGDTYVTIDTVITVLCQDQYGSIGVAESVCLSTGQWFPSPKSCREVPAAMHHVGEQSSDDFMTTPATTKTTNSISFFQPMTKLESEYVISLDPSPTRRLRFVPELGGAAAAGRVVDVETILKRGADVNSRRYDGRKYCGWDRMQNATALILAAACNQSADVVKQLLIYGAEVDLPSENGNTALVAAAAWGNVDVMELLLDYGADVNAQNHLGKTPLMKAASNSRLTAVRLLLEHGAMIDAHDVDNWTALSVAGFYGNIEVAGLLLSYGADRSKCPYPACFMMP